MKINIFLTLVSFLLTALLGYWIFDTARGKENDIICGVLSFICLLSTLIPLIGLRFYSVKLGVNIRILSGFFFIIFLISHFCSALFGIKMPFYIIINAILLLLYLAVLYKMQDIKDI
ncbi:MAG: hypothetical protein IK144_11555 [Bacteroidaceae bacterium]|nr:hypothetical protein [Bacteroidaceae bacterium]